MIINFRSAAHLTLAFLSIYVLSSFFTPAMSADNPFPEHRMRVQQGHVQVDSVRGLVVDAVGDDRLVTNIAPAALAAKGIEDSDNVTLTVGKETMRARIMSERSFSDTMSDAQLRDSLDVDIICLLAPARMEVVGLGGGLVEWLGPNKRMPVVVEKEHY